MLRVASEGLREPGIERDREARPHHGDAREVAALDGEADGSVRLAVEWKLAGQAPVRDSGERPDVRALVDIVRALELLGAHVPGAPDARSRHSERRTAPVEAD